MRALIVAVVGLLVVLAQDTTTFAQDNQSDQAAPEWVMLAVTHTRVDGEWVADERRMVVRRRTIDTVEEDGPGIAVRLRDAGRESLVHVDSNIEVMCAVLRCEHVPTRLQQSARDELRRRIERAPERLTAPDEQP